MDIKYPELSLKTLAGGGAVERFDDELRNVLGNILDPNTDATAKRSITLTVDLVPDADRKTLDIRIKCAARLGALRMLKSFGYIGLDKGKPVATEYNPQQPGLPFQVAESKEETK